MFALVEIVARIAVALLGHYMASKAKDEQGRRDYLAFIEIMNRKGLTSVEMRKKAVDQIRRVDELWDAEKKIKSESPPS